MDAIGFYLARSSADDQGHDQLQAERYRLVTRSDFDGLVCAALLKELGHPRRHQVRPPQGHAGRQGRARPPTTSRPTSRTSRACTWPSTTTHSRDGARRATRPTNHVIVAGRRVRRARRLRLLRRRRALPGHLRGDDGRRSTRPTRRSSRSRRSSIPTGWVLLNFLMDPRTGLGRFRDFRISNYQLMMQLIDACTTMTVEEILATPDVAERVELYHDARRARPRSRSAAARPCTATSSCSTSATRRSSTRRTAS